MDKYWIEFSFPVPAGEVDLVSDLLYGIGCIGVNVEEKELDTFVVPNPEENLPATFMVKAYFEQSETVSPVEDEIVADINAELLRTQAAEEDPASKPEGGDQHEPGPERQSRNDPSLPAGRGRPVRPETTPPYRS